MSDDKDWVEKRAIREKWLELRGPQLWADLRTAMEHAVESFKTHYSGRWNVSLNPGYEDSFSVGTQHMAEDEWHRRKFRYRKKDHSVLLDDHESPELRIIIDGSQGHFTKDGTEQLTIEEASQFLLESFLYREPMKKPYPR